MSGGYTTSYRWSGVKRADVAGLVRHDLRDVDLQNGVEVSHSNDKIDPTMTALNETVVNDGQGGFKECTASSQWIDFIDGRVAEAKNYRVMKDGTRVPVAVRKDAAVVVETILMLDPEFTGPCAQMDDDDREETRELLQVMIDTEIERAGVENVVGWSVHWDETHPHVQMMSIPMTEDGQLSMKQVLGAKTKAAAQAKYSQAHDVMRANLRAAGYDATNERVDTARSHLPLEQFKKLRDDQARIGADKDKAAAMVAVASKDGQKADADRKMARDDRQSAAEELAGVREEIPAIRRRAREEGHAQGYLDGKADAEAELAQERERTRRLQEEAERVRRSAAFAHQDATALTDRLIEQLDGKDEPFMAKWVEKNGHGPAYRKDRAVAERLRRRAVNTLADHSEAVASRPGQDVSLG